MQGESCLSAGVCPEHPLSVCWCNMPQSKAHLHVGHRLHASQYFAQLSCTSHASFFSCATKAVCQGQFPHLNATHHVITRPPFTPPLPTLLTSKSAWLNDQSTAAMQASDVTALVAVQAQVAVLQEAHAMLSCHLDLDSWAETWAAADGQQAFAATASRVAHAMTAHMIGDLLPNFAYCEPTHRFARMVRAAAHHHMQCCVAAPYAMMHCNDATALGHCIILQCAMLQCRVVCLRYIATLQ